jgi:diadenylate cyclase
VSSKFELFRILFVPVTLIDLLDILVISFVIYQLYMFVRGSRAGQMAVGLVLIFLVSFIAQLFNMRGLSWIFGKLETIWLVAFVVIFHPELRRVLVYIGQSPIIRYFVKVTGSRMIDEVVKAAQELSRLRHGALIVIARDDSMKFVVETGIRLQAQISAPLLLSFFSPKSPLHDGATVLENEEIVAAKAILPLTENDRFDRRYGTRHRAALGLAEETDAVIIVVSEETGRISLAKEGNLITDLSAEELENLLNASMKVRPEE